MMRSTTELATLCIADSRDAEPGVIYAGGDGSVMVINVISDRVEAQIV